MISDDVHSRLRLVFAEVLGDPFVRLDPELQMGSVEAWDSFAQITLMLGIEAEFGIEFDSDEIGELVSVGAISKALERRLIGDA